MLSLLSSYTRPMVIFLALACIRNLTVSNEAPPQTDES
jgi:hypothetical protein